MKRSRTAVLLALLAFAVLGAVSSAQGQRLSQPCDPAHPETCLYTSDLDYSVGVLDGVVLTDPSRHGYQIPVLVRYPIEATDPRPVVIWHHGGVTSPRGRTRSEEWGNALAAAGYVVVHPSRLPPADVTPFLRECAANGYPDPAECGEWYGLHRSAARTTSFLIDHLADLSPLLRGRVDASRVVVGGHSGGTVGVLSVAGASQQFVPGGPVYDEVDPRPIAFLATAPQGPMYAGFRSGFDEHRSFGGITRPLMTITGMGDETGEPIPTRLTAWITSQPGDKLLLWDTDPHAVHETMDIDKCEPPVPAGHCDWIESAGLAYLDAVVRRRPEARAWLESDAIGTLTGGAIELHRR
jgi:hypothetical protein